MTIQLNQTPLQFALFKAARVGNINLMREFIALGADPYAADEIGRSALSYAMAASPTEIGNLISELDSNKGGDDEQ